MNLVTSGNATISALTCIVGLLLILPRSNVLASARYAVFAMSQGRITSSHERGVGDRVETPVADAPIELDTDRYELVDA